MRFFIINTYYPDFLHNFYEKHVDISRRHYADYLQILMDQCFGTADFYSTNLKKLSHDAHVVVANCETLQKSWALEHDIHIEKSTISERWVREVLLHVHRIVSKTPLHHLKSFLQPILGSLVGQQSWFYDILAAQIKYYKPDVVLNLDVNSTRSRFLREMKPYVRLLVGQHAATKLSDSEDWRCYDLVISSFLPTIDWFRQKGIPAELLRLGFEPRVLSRMKPGSSSFDLTFVGSFFSVHRSRVALLEVLCDRFEQIRIWGPKVDSLPSDSPIRRCYVGQAWGREMYQILCDSNITLNHHGDVAPYANNCRLFEATGAGTMLITDWKENLHEMLEPGKEVVAYRSVEECIELIQYYLEHEEERKTIAHAGQQRTLREHTYYQRMKELVEIIHKFL